MNLASNEARVHRQTAEQKLKLDLLLDLGSMIAQEVDLDSLLGIFESRVAAAMGADRATLWLLEETTGQLRTRVANPSTLEPLTIPLGHGIAGTVARTGKGINIGDVESDGRWAREFDRRTGYTTRSMLTVAVRAGTRTLGVVQVLNKHGGAFTDQDESFLATLSGQIARAMEYTSLRGLSANKGVSVRGRFNHVIGDSPPMERAYEKVLSAASTDATVLLHGETGTGKGLFARAIHVNSNYADGPFVHLDVTSLPAGLMESELFGHEQGAYTGADRRVIGKVERAAGGTLFLDEIDDLSLEMQGKLLRFLQERRFERLGGRETHEVDVRLVVATNRNLEALVRDGRFRSDLYYRIRVIDIELPPLRERGPNDIRGLALHFLDLYSRRYERPLLHFSEGAIEALLQHSWPGNVRELEHSVERAVVLAGVAEIDASSLGLVDMEAMKTAAVQVANAEGAVVLEPGLSLDEATRRYAFACLDANGGNQSAAARTLQIGRNRLARMLKKRDL